MASVKHYAKHALEVALYVAVIFFLVRTVGNATLSNLYSVK